MQFATFRLSTPANEAISLDRSANVKRGVKLLLAASSYVTITDLVHSWRRPAERTDETVERLILNVTTDRGFVSLCEP